MRAGCPYNVVVVVVVVVVVFFFFFQLVDAVACWQLQDQDHHLHSHPLFPQAMVQLANYRAFAVPYSGIVHHLSGPNSYALTQIHPKTSGSVDDVPLRVNLSYCKYLLSTRLPPMHQSWLVC